MLQIIEHLRFYYKILAEIISWVLAIMGNKTPLCHVTLQTLQVLTLNLLKLEVFLQQFDLVYMHYAKLQ